MAPEEWINDLIRAHYAALFRSTYSYLGDEAASEELVDDVFARVWDMRDRLTSSDVNMAGYLSAAVRNRALNLLNSERYAERRRLVMRATDEYPGVAQRDPLPDESAEGGERGDILWSAVAQLPERTRAILTMRWQYQLTWDEIAKALGITEASAKMAHSRALQTLKDCLPAFFSDPAQR